MRYALAEITWDEDGQLTLRSTDQGLVLWGQARFGRLVGEGESGHVEPEAYTNGAFYGAAIRGFFPRGRLGAVVWQVLTQLCAAGWKPVNTTYAFNPNGTMCRGYAFMREEGDGQA
jgi:hypothetical protein